MLTNVILSHVAKATAVILPPAVLVAYFTMGPDAALALAVGMGLSVGDAAGMIYLVGQMMDPTTGGSKKGIFGLLLVLKLTIVGGLLYYAAVIMGLHQLGIVVGIGLGLIATVFGANRGSTSEEGRAAIAEAEKNIRDSEEQTR